MTDPQTQLPFDTPARSPRKVPGIDQPLRVNIAAFIGRLDAAAPTTGVTLPTLHFPMPPVELLDDERLGEPGTAPDEERVASYVEHRARQLFELIRDAALLDQTALRFERTDASYDTAPTAIALRQVHLDTNRHYSELLCEYAELLGNEAADDLADWLDQLAERVDTPRPVPKPGNPLPGVGGPS